MAINSRNKYPADKTGTRYAEFKNTKRLPKGRSRTERTAKQSGGNGGSSADETAGKTTT